MQNDDVKKHVFYFRYLISNPMLDNLAQSASSRSLKDMGDAFNPQVIVKLLTLGADAATEHYNKVLSQNTYTALDAAVANGVASIRSLSPQWEQYISSLPSNARLLLDATQFGIAVGKNAYNHDWFGLFRTVSNAIKDEVLNNQKNMTGVPFPAKMLNNIHIYLDKVDKDVILRSLVMDLQSS